MARSTKTTRSSARRAPEPAPKKRPGRPLGSKNRVKSPTSAKAVPVARTTRAAPRKTAAPAPKLNKAELEAQIVRLERTIVRLRKQNAELKQTAHPEGREAAEAPPAPVETRRLPKRTASAPARRRAGAKEEPEAQAPAAAKRTSRRGTKSRTSRAAEPNVEQEPAAPEDHDDEADPEG